MGDSILDLTEGDILNIGALTYQENIYKNASHTEAMAAASSVIEKALLKRNKKNDKR